MANINCVLMLRIRLKKSMLSFDIHLSLELHSFQFCMIFQTDCEVESRYDSDFKCDLILNDSEIIARSNGFLLQTHKWNGLKYPKML